MDSMTRSRIAPLAAALAVALLGAVGPGCVASRDRDFGPEWTLATAAESAACANLPGDYTDEGEASGTNSGEPVRAQRHSLAEVLELASGWMDDTPPAERALAVVRLGSGRFALRVVQVLPTDKVTLAEIGAHCAGTELRLEIPSRYESRDGVQVERRTIKASLFKDTEGNLVLRREARDRSLGVVDLRRGGSPVSYYRFARREN